MINLFSTIINVINENHSAVLATLIKRTGSTPRDAGTRFLILDDGTFHGTIGGGELEARVIEEALRVLGSGRPARFEFQLTGIDAADTDMICGGSGEVFLEPIFPRNPFHVQLFERALKLLQHGGSGMMVTSVDPDRWSHEVIPKAFLGPEAEATGSILGAREMSPSLISALWSLQGEEQVETTLLQDETFGAIEVLIERVAANPVLYVFGGGHVAVETVRLAARVGFQVVVIDDRPEFADPGRFPDAGEVREASFQNVFDQLPVNSSSYLVIVTRGHIHDKTVLEQGLRTDARYIGMIGSTRKTRIIFDRLMEEGFDQTQLKRVHAPIGLDIGAETPEEIAVSIVAELVLARAGGGKRDKKQSNPDETAAREL